MADKFARLMRNSGPARFFVPIGIILIVFGVIMLGFNSENYLETTGTVTEVIESFDEENQAEYDVYFTYTVDGKTYENSFGGMSERQNKGDKIKVLYNPENPEQVSNARISGLVAPIMIGVGALAIVFGIYRTVKAFKKSKELDQTAKAPAVAFDGFKTAPGVTEYYCRFDGKTLKPGYILEDAARNVLFEGKMTKQALVGARTFEFNDRTTGRVSEHQVGHTATQTLNDEFFSVSSWFKFDGKNIWDVLHEKGLRMTTGIFSRFPNLTYEVSKNGQAFAYIETSGKFVHEDEAAEHSVNLPIGRYYYRIWTNSRDFETLFLTVFAISETEQTIVE